MTKAVVVVALFLLNLCVTEGKKDVWDELRHVQTVFSPKNPDFFVGKKAPDNFTTCEKHVNEYVKQLQTPWQAITPGTGGMWALKMFDSSGKIMDGIFQGNTQASGNVHGCVNVEAKRRFLASDLEPFNGKYMMIFVTQEYGRGARNMTNEEGRMPILFPSGQMFASFAPAGSFFAIGLCLPNSCSDEEIFTAVTNRLNEIGPQWAVYMNTGLEKDRKTVLDLGDGAMIFFLAVLFVLLVTGTGMDYWNSSQPTNTNLKFWNKFLVGFSLRINCERMTNTTVQKKGNHIGCIDGIRFISMSWVVLCHVYASFTNQFPVQNRAVVLDFMESPAFQAVLNAYPSVDSFFLLTGTLLTYLTLKEQDKVKGGGISFWSMFYIHRYLRLTGVYAFVVCFVMTLYKHFVVGPRAIYVTMTSALCREDWWRNLLYINNFADSNGEHLSWCVGQTWYLANDMQMFIVSPLIIYPLWKWKVPGLIFAALLTVGSGIVPAVLTYLKSWPATFLLDRGSDYFEWNYVKPWCRFSPFIVGILLGYLLFVTKNKPFKMSRLVNVSGWILAFGIGVAVIYGLNIPDNGFLVEEPLSVAENVIYGGFHRLAWAIALAWVVFACAKGYGGGINDILCWGGFVPLSRLSYIIYLIHLAVIDVFVTSYTFSFDVSHMLVAILIFAILAYSIAVSAIIYVCVELPWLNSEKLIVSSLYNNGGSRQKKTTT